MQFLNIVMKTLVGISVTDISIYTITLLIILTADKQGSCNQQNEGKEGKHADVNTAANDGDMESKPDNKFAESRDGSEHTKSYDIVVYRRLFQQKRRSHKEAVHTMLSLGSQEKQKKMVNAVMAKIFSVLERSRTRLTEAGYTPGDPFPSDESVKDALSSVLENTAFLGDIVLRLPDITHAAFKENQQWKLITQWTVGFCNDTLIFVDKDFELLQLMAQELELVERDPAYINPYRADNIKAEQEAQRKLDEESLAALKKAEKERRRKEKKNKNKGPRMSAPRHNEL